MSVLSPIRGTAGTKVKIKAAGKAGLAHKCQRQKEEKGEALRGCLLLNQQHGVSEKVNFIKISNSEIKTLHIFVSFTTSNITLR